MLRGAPSRRSPTAGCQKGLRGIKAARIVGPSQRVVRPARGCHPVSLRRLDRVTRKRLEPMVWRAAAGSPLRAAPSKSAYHRARRRRRVLTSRSYLERTGEDDKGPLANFWAIVSLPDNIPIVLMLGLVGYFVWLSLAQAKKHDRLIADGHREQVLKTMQD